MFQITKNRWDQLNKEIYELHKSRDPIFSTKLKSDSVHFALETLQHEQWQSSSAWALKNYNYNLDSLSSLLSYNQTFSTFTLELTLVRNKGLSHT